MTEAFPMVDAVLHVDGVGPIGRAVNEPGYWKDRDRAELQTGHVATVFSYTETWTYQERHPDGDELAVVIDGEADLLLDDGRGEQSTRVGCGGGCVIPAGSWHRVATCEPVTILFLTPVPARTEHRDASAGGGYGSGVGPLAHLARAGDF
jgi:mannose-6-phosphate isomerase-like protein (cupin superfamily)